MTVKAWDPKPWSPCGSKGLDSLVAKLLVIPPTVMKGAVMGHSQDVDIKLDSAVDLVARIQKISPDSPGGASIPAAISIGWDVVGWLQDFSSRAQFAACGTGRARKGGTVSLDALAEVGIEADAADWDEAFRLS